MNLGIQGLRGIAILLVLLNHAGIPGFAGGYVGVDIFFVISGYLIGGLLWREGLRNGRIAIWDFYARRIRRLFPADAFLLLAVGLASLLLLAPEEWNEMFSALRAAQLYLINIWFTSRATDYFGGHSAANPLLHLWSLAVEEQFYLVWPWLVMLCLRGGAEHFTRRLSWVTAWVAAGSLIACIGATWASQPLAFFNMPFRMWEFAAGIGLAIRPISVGPKLRAALGWSSAAGLSAVTVLMDEGRQFPGLWAVFPVVCAQGLLIAAVGSEPGRLQRVLSWSPLVVLGNCSYSVYLWHWPVLIFAAVLWPQAGAGTAAILLLASVLAGWASWRWIEEPLRANWLVNWKPRRFVAMSLVLASGLALAASIPRNWPIDDAQREIAQQRQLRPHSVKAGCHARLEDVDLPDCVFGVPEAARAVVLWGDSHAVNWFPALEVLARRHGWRLISLTKSGCPSVDVPVWNKLQRRSYIECERWREAMFRRIAEARPMLVVLANMSRYGVERSVWQQGLDSTLSRLAAAGVDIAVMRDTPRLPVDVPTCVARAQWRAEDINASCGYSVEERRLWHDDMALAQAEVLARHGKVLGVDMSDAFCVGSTCAVADGNQLRFYDDNHLTPVFSAGLSDQLAVSLQKAAIKTGNASIGDLFARAK